MIKAICMDLDGTLLTSEKEVSPASAKALKAFAIQGGYLVLASGRTRNRMEECVAALSLDTYGGKLIESNGASFYDYETDTYEVIRRMEVEEAREVVAFLKQYPVEILIMGNESVFIILPEGQQESYYLNNLKKTNMEGLRNRIFTFVKSVDEIDEEMNKVSVSAPSEVVLYLCEELEKHSFHHEYWWGLTLIDWLEIVPAAISKGNALLRLMQKYGWQRDEVIVFGDGENDLSMLGVVENSVAMGNALPSVKEVCKYICDTNDHDGISEFLKEVIV